ncbi:hypothetical protein [Sphingomonas sp. SAFR-052]|uniref:hypothetical protein n=1 Tax=Sphingomonas sp. SAFR-052 TaxID=3436867 RepID=UPI003F7D1F9F
MAFDARVADALHAVETIARMQATGARLAIPKDARGKRMSTSWLLVRRPSDRLFYVLRRRNRLQVTNGGWHLVLDGPYILEVDAMHRWSIAAVSALQNFLGEEATFIACHMLGR